MTVTKSYIQFPRDPNDEPILNLAIQVKADYLVERDRDLLDLGQSAYFRLLFPFIKIVDPLVFVEELNKISFECLHDPPIRHPFTRDGTVCRAKVEVEPPSYLHEVELPSDLHECFRRHPRRAPRLIEQDRPRTRRPLIQR